jgi:uncharacterized membrane protein
VRPAGGRGSRLGPGLLTRVETGRVEAFSDGVIAIAITLLVLEIHVPEAPPGGLGRALLDQWPSYAAYAVSFAVIGIMWVNHHRIFHLVATVDRPLLFINLMLLMFIALFPFPTALLAEHLRSGGSDAQLAAAVYSANATGCAIAFNLMWRWIVRDDRLIHAHLSVRALQRGTRRFTLGLIVYPIAIGMSFVSAPLTLGLHALTALYYVVDQLVVRHEDQESAA